jgi:hypothetical protein
VSANIGKNATTTKTETIGLGTIILLGIVFVLDIYRIFLYVSV